MVEIPSPPHLGNNCPVPLGAHVHHVLTELYPAALRHATQTTLTTPINYPSRSAAIRTRKAGERERERERAAHLTRSMLLYVHRTTRLVRDGRHLTQERKRQRRPGKQPCSTPMVVPASRATSLCALSSPKQTLPPIPKHSMFTPPPPRRRLLTACPST